MASVADTVCEAGTSSSGTGDAGAVCIGANSSSKMKYGKISDALDEVDKELKDEEETLLRMKEQVMKEMRVLKVLAPDPRIL